MVADFASFASSSRNKRINCHARTGEILRPDHRLSLDSGFGDTIWRVVAPLHRIQTGSDVDDSAPSATYKVREDRRGHQKCAEYIYMNRPFPGENVGFENRTIGARE